MADERGRNGIRRRPKLEDVARLAGVSVSTVSRVINSHENVDDRTRGRVLESVRALGYRPSSLARGLALQRTNMIGLIVSDITNPFFPEIVNAVERTARLRGYMPLLCIMEDTDPSTDEYVDRLVDNGVGGLVVASAKPEDTYLIELRDHGIPMVLINRRHPAFVDSFVVSDYRAGAQLAVEHLVSLGHEQVAHISGPPGVIVSEERERGYLDAIEKQDLDFLRVVRAVDFSPDAGRKAVHELMEGQRRPSAIFVANDYCALGVLQGLAEMGLRVPEDVAIVGYDDISLASLPFIDLTTVSSRIDEMASLGCDVTIDLIQRGEAAAPPRILAPELKIRGTCGSNARAVEAAPAPPAR